MKLRAAWSDSRTVCAEALRAPADAGPPRPLAWLANRRAANEQDLVDLICCDQAGRQLQLLLEPQAERHHRPVVPPHGPLPVVYQPPHAEIDKARGAWLHPEHGTGSYHQGV